MSRVVLTGATGFLGANLLRALARRGDEVHVLLRPLSDDTRLRKPGLTFERHLCDLADLSALRKTLVAVRPERIFHVAAYGAGRGQRDPVKLFSGNVLAAHHILEATRDLDLARLVCTGGSSEYGHHSKPLSETSPIEPVTPYGAAKAAATLVFQRAARDGGRPIVVLRPFSIYGPLESATRLVPTAIRAALAGTTLPLTRGLFVRDFVFVEDVVDACIAASEAAGVEGETFNIGTGIETSNQEVVAMVEKVLDCRIDVDLGAYQENESDTSCWRADPTKARERLKWQAKVGFEEGIRRTVDFHRDFHSHGNLHGNPEKRT